MRTYKYLRVKGLPFFKDQTFDLNQRGISAILGLNLNGGKGSTNYVGKSLFFSQILEARYSDNSLRKDKLRKGGIEFGLETNGHEYVVRRTFTRPEKLTIFEDGADKGFKEIKQAEEFLHGLLPLSIEQSQVLMYIDNTKPHPLRTTDTGARRKFFTDFFDLTATDSVKKWVKAEKDALHEQAVLKTELSRKLAELKASKPQYTEEELQAKLETARAKVTVANAKFKKAKEADSLRSFLTSNSESIAVYRKYAGKAAKIKERVSLIKLILSARKESEAYEAELRAWKKSRKALTDYFDGVEDVEDYGRKVLAAYEKAKADLTKREELYEEESRSYTKLNTKASILLAKRENKQQELADLKPEGDCSKCGQPVTNKHYRKEKAALKEEISALSEELDKYEGLLEPVKPKPTEKQVRIQEAYEFWKDRPRVGPKPELPSVLEGFDTEDDKDLDEELAILRERLFHIKTVEASGFADRLDENTEGLDIDTAMASVVRSTDLVKDLEFQLQSLRDLNTEGKELAVRLKGIAKELEELEVLEVLEKAYGSNTGVKQIMINMLCSKLAAQVNKYSKRLFPEDYTFSFDLEANFHINVTRLVSGQEFTSDVRKLSGAEAGCFNLLLAISMLTFIPEKERPNILVLDEIDANFGPEMTESFIRFLPVLNKVIPHIIVITPLSENDYGENVNYYTVVKKGAVSTIKKGRVQ